MDEYDELIVKIEDEELENEILTAERYIQLIAAYLYKNQLIEAKNLCKRIPRIIRTDNKEIQQLQHLILALMANHYADFFNNINYAWSDCIKQTMEELIKKTRKDVFNLVGNAHVSITEANLMKLTLFSREQLKETCAELDWAYENCNQQTIIIPKRPPMQPRPCASSEDQLFKLTEFVSFLEN